ncbi:VapE domain-containing protein [Peptostreptococcus equinus]|uniref:VapE family protein n=1 Tax=Peptostreptococcus equinus TaxID=3003601 RepID=A0ABY7JM21_9FIRM|nr:VapE domain-containing protein [Peptostreptococcus sp. CBA3647]WAW14413.1 VapE family protein [Peptostreptococcus sp. CBA3647]
MNLDEIVNNIPDELKIHNIWCVRDKDKRPYKTNLVNGKLVGAKPTDSNTWGSLNEALALVGNTYSNWQGNNTKINGLGVFVSTSFVAIDLDHVINDKGELLPEAREIIESIDSYAEISPSGTGIHIITKSNKPLLKDGSKGIKLDNLTGWIQTDEKGPEIEIYQAKRYLTITGNVFGGQYELKESTKAIHDLYDKYFGHRDITKSDTVYTDFVSYEDGDTEIESMADKVILEIALNYRPKDDPMKFNRLFNDGDIEGYLSGSEADMGLIGIITEFTKDTRVIDCIYKKSNFYLSGERTAKWDRPDYKRDTILKALNSKDKEKSRLKVNENGTILHIIENVKAILDSMGYVMGYDVVKGEMTTTNMIYEKGLDHLMTHIYSYCREIGFNINDKILGLYVLNIALDNKFNPFKDYLEKCESVRYKGEIDKLIKTLEYDIPFSEVHDYKKIEELYNTMIKKWLISVVAINYNDNLMDDSSKAVEGTLVLKGEQGIGKTTWLRNLVPKGFFKEGGTLTDSKDNKMETYKYIIVELGELETTTRKQASGFLKNELTRTSIEYRPPYGKSVIKFARHTIFCGSVNEDSFLKDSTGNRRFWVVPVKDINLNNDVDIDKLWSEVVGLYKAGNKWFLTKEERELLDELNNEYIGLSPIGMEIRNTFDFNKPKDSWRYVEPSTVYEIIRGGLGGNYISDNVISDQLKILGCKRTDKRWVPSLKKQQRLWLVPPLKNNLWSMNSPSKPKIWKLEEGKMVECDDWGK